MNRALLGLCSTLTAVLVGSGVPVSEAHASPLGQGIALGPRVPAPLAPACAHRSAEHAAQHHETREGDSRWHELHGDLPTCNLDKADDTDDKDHEKDDPRWRVPHDDKRQSDDPDNGDGTPLYRDHEGYHCYHLHCG